MGISKNFIAGNQSEEFNVLNMPFQMPFQLIFKCCSHLNLYFNHLEPSRVDVNAVSG